MIRKLLILAGIFMMFQFGYSLRCSKPARYGIKEHDVLYSEVPIKGIDKNSFENLDNVLGTDKNHVYYRGKILKTIDRSTF